MVRSAYVGGFVALPGRLAKLPGFDDAVCLGQSF